MRRGEKDVGRKPEIPKVAGGVEEGESRSEPKNRVRRLLGKLPGER